jgi:hypothetical protein
VESPIAVKWVARDCGDHRIFAVRVPLSYLTGTRFARLKLAWVLVRLVFA